MREERKKESKQASKQARKKERKTEERADRNRSPSRPHVHRTRKYSRAWKPLTPTKSTGRMAITLTTCAGRATTFWIGSIAHSSHYLDTASTLKEAFKDDGWLSDSDVHNNVEWVIERAMAGDTAGAPRLLVPVVGTKQLLPRGGASAGPGQSDRSHGF